VTPFFIESVEIDHAEAVLLAERNGLTTYDATIIATMTANMIEKLFTFNADDFKKFSDVELIGI
jgi:predicted nucleic acid-binding protein